LSLEEQRRRYVIKSILNSDGLDLKAYQARFGHSALTDIIDLNVLLDAHYLTQTETHLLPTRLGLERADAMGPFLVSSQVKETMKAYAWA